MIIDTYRLAGAAVVIKSFSKRFPPTSFILGLRKHGGNYVEATTFADYCSQKVYTNVLRGAPIYQGSFEEYQIPPA